MQDSTPSNGKLTPGINSDRDLLARLAPLDDRYNRLILLGEPTWVASIIKSLHLCHLGEAALWSPPMPTGRPGQVVRILARPRLAP